MSTILPTLGYHVISRKPKAFISDKLLLGEGREQMLAWAAGLQHSSIFAFP